MKRMNRFTLWLAKRQWAEKIELAEWSMQRSRYLTPGNYEHEEELHLNYSISRLDGGYGTTYFLQREITVPGDWAPEEAALLYLGRGEGLLKINGAPYHGLDSNHWFIPLPPGTAGGELQLEIELYDPVPEPEDPLNRQAVIKPPLTEIEITLVRVNPSVFSLLHTVKIVHEAALLLPEGDMRRIRSLKALERVMDTLYMKEELLVDGDAVTAAEQQLRTEAAAERSAGLHPGTMHMVGQSHIDIAWLWPVRETVRKVSRTFSTVCALMDKYPEFRYSQSQPQLYAFAKEHYPQLYGRIKERIAEGRWELVGGMWVEPDLNIPGGESLVRQMLYGQGFYMEEFGKHSTIEWLPDTFGYCASLPQLLKQAGIEYFMTTKLGWNDTNPFPHTLFHWVGIDGTKIVAYQNHGVNEHTHPKDVQEHWQAYDLKVEHEELMLLYGHGDGGGGVTHEMLEYVARTDLAPGQPVSRFSTAEAFFSGVGSRQPELPAWHGDLYLELHRGTFTTHAFNKRSNRKAEVLYRQAEIWSVLAQKNNHPEPVQPAQERKQLVKPQEELAEGWKLLLLNQFHDIIPGTSIPEVYTTSREEYAEIFRLGQQVLDTSLRALAGEVNTAGEGRPYVVFNSLGWERTEVIRLEGGCSLMALQAFDEDGQLESECWNTAGAGYILAVRVRRVPAFGCRTFWLREAAAPAGIRPDLEADAVGGWHGQEAAPLTARDSFPEQWETDHYILTFNEDGEISRWVDKSAGRELLQPGQTGNQLQFYHDTPPLWDAWDLDPRYEQQPAGKAKLLDRQVVTSGPVLTVLKFRWQLNESLIEQEITLPMQGRRVDFQTRVSWREEHKLLKVAFPVDIVAAKATYEIPFGSLERPTHRNTSWEQAQFEVCGHRWADLSEGGYGVSLLNDCKYGYDIHDGVLRLSLLRSPRWPDRYADQGEHEFTYSLYPHGGEWRQAGVVREAAELNAPLQVVSEEPHAGRYPSTHAWLAFQSRHVMLDTIKRAEDGSGVIVRLYESAGSRETAELDWRDGDIRASQVNLLESDTGSVVTSGGVISLSFRPYEVQTVKLYHETYSQEE
ncbi:alpha-mannosidase [Paenibacillus sp. FSL R5-0912]|uniref:alpha-mannosidase n=1 Tax=Paenibacillus sp. FSL R5-0912 TaxID=1536771 RepID=UPI0004F7BE44|nr:alpha-mannosidase [Paenibacillus sp. FSL R5-0912]AIQ43762.1 alpha-mannosidase [Paenibacillus sp. FSL R5-0912]